MRSFISAVGILLLKGMPFLPVSRCFEGELSSVKTLTFCQSTQCAERFSFDGKHLLNVLVFWRKEKNVAEVRKTVLIQS